MVSSQLYRYVFILMGILCFAIALPMVNSPDNQIMKKGNRSMSLAWILTIVCTFWFGGRQLFMAGYVDTANYALEYIRMQPTSIEVDWFHGEWIWQFIMVTCKLYGVSAQSFFTIVEAGYLFSVMFAVRIFTPRWPFLTLVFVYSSLFFLPFGVNGIRNGLACHIILWAIALLLDSKRMWAAVAMFIAFGIHRSTALPIAGIVASLTLVKNVKFCVAAWLLSIPVSFLFGGWFTNFFAGLGFDDRMAQYAEEIDSSFFSSTGFRWDFLLYSSMPVYMAYYVCVKKEISDTWYNALCCTYLMCNSFWVLVITSSYSNRFAYLSWFLYPIIIAYPLIMLPVWHDQDSKSGYILVAYLLFSVGMNLMWHSY